MGDTTSTSAAPKVESSTASPVEPNKPTTVEKVTDVKSETAVKTPKKELNGKKWIIEYQKGSLVTVHGTAEQRIYVFDCQDNTIKISGKVNTITIDKCKKTKFVFDSVISQVEVINSKSVQGQVLDLCPTLTIDGSSGLMFYVSSESKAANFQVISSRSDGVNILLSSEDSFEEVPIPDQFRTTFKNNEPI